ncbi:MAG TPA: M14 metallopeptidase family protein [Bryobacteraceae bacterium]|nr:M14 metallopeptidase family protein [Bryobacteraceae bacterium]
MKSRLVSFLLVSLSAAAQVPAHIPTPESHFGHRMGVDRELLDWDKVVSYFQALAQSSNEIRVQELGKTAEGRPFIAATISAPQTLRDLDHYREIQAKLADPRRTTPEESAKLIAEGKTVVLITCSIHATEVASTHSVIQFVYNLLTQDTPKFRAILDNVIILLVPSQNPDGLDIVTRWYRKTLDTPFEGSAPPELYQKYVGHDNNRDWYVFSQPETRLTVSLQNTWHPQIVYDVHQQGAYASRMFVPPWLDPIDPNVDAILAQEGNYLGMSIAADLTGAGKRGVVTNALYDFWAPARQYMAYHGGIRILSEAASAALASPLTVTPDQIQSSGLGYNPRERSWNYLQPWRGGTWRIGDIVDYQLIAFESLLYQAAIRRSDLLRNFYEVGRHAVARTSPYAFVIPREQMDPSAARKMLELLSFGDVEVERANDAFEAGGTRYAEGSYVVRMQQPYSSYAKTLLERQHYPDLRSYPGGPPQRPYDVTAQTLPLLMGVATDTIAAPFRVTSRLVKSFQFDLSSPRVEGDLPASDVDSWREANKAWSSGASIWRDIATGDFFARQPKAGQAVELTRPRIALYKSYVPAIDEGWTRWLLENFGFAYRNILNPEIEAGNLRQRFDVIVFPDQPATQIANGFAAGTMPQEYTGGLGKQAAANLREFAEQGGTLIFLNHAANYAVEHLHLDIKNVLEGVSSRDFYSPGSLLNATLDPRSRLAYGLPEHIAIWSEDSPAWEIPPGSKGRVIVRYPSDHVLASGWLLGERYIENRAALVELPLGQGRAVLFGMRPQYRAQSYQAFKLFFNSLVLSSARPVP